MTIETVLTLMNRAFKADPDAVHALLCNRIPCTEALADDPFIVVDKSHVTGNFNVGLLGFINGILGELGEPMICSSWSDSADEEGRRTLLGFISEGKMYSFRSLEKKVETDD